MRCPKCSFISFDDLAVCAKCAGDLSALSRELNGTCIEAKPEFFLGTAIQSSGMDGDNFSDSQALPPIDHGGINFDDTSTGGFSPLSSTSDKSVARDFDDSLGVSSEDDVAIELGDIMPIDLDQLDDTSVFSGVKMAETDSFDPASFALDFDKTETVRVAASHDVDHDLTGKFASTNLDLELDGDFSDIDIDDSGLDFPGNTSATSSGHDTSQEQLSLDPKTQASLNNSVGVDLDDELIAQLSSFVDDPDSTASFLSDSPVADESDLIGMGDAGDSEGILDFDESLAAELTGSFPVNESSDELKLDYSDDHSGSGEFELDEALVAELAGDSIPGNSVVDVGLAAGLEGTDVGAPIEFIVEDSTETAVEDLTGEFAPITYADEPELGDLNLSDIDVSDLIEPSGEDKTLMDAGDAMVPSDAPAGVTSVDEIAMEFGAEKVDDEAVQPLALGSGDELVLEESLVGSDLFDEIDVSEFETELSGSSGSISADDDAFPEIELIPDGDEDDDGPPDLPL